MTSTVTERLAIAPGSVVVVRDEEWLVTATADTADGLLIHVQGLGELVRDTTASFFASLDTITRSGFAPFPKDPDPSGGYGPIAY